MSPSPLLKRARSRLERQREQDRERWEQKPAAFRKAMIRWGLRIVAIALVLALALYRLSGGRIL